MLTAVHTVKTTGNGMLLASVRSPFLTVQLVLTFNVLPHAWLHYCISSPALQCGSVPNDVQRNLISVSALPYRGVPVAVHAYLLPLHILHILHILHERLVLPSRI